MMSSQKSLFFIGGGVLAAAIGVFYLSDKTKKSKTSQPQTVSRSSLQSQAPLSEIPTSISQKYGLDIGNRSNYQDKDASDSLKESKNILNQHFTTNLLPGFRLPAQLDADNFNKVKAPPIITSVLVLNLFKKALKEYLYSIHDKLTQLKKKGVRIAANNTQVTAALKNVNLESIREKILVKEGFDGFEDAPSQVFAEALQKYSKEDPDEFNKKLKKLQDQTAKVMKSLMGVSKNAVYLIEALGDHLVVGSEGMSHSRVKSLQASLVLEQITELSAEDEADN